MDSRLRSVGTLLEREHELERVRGAVRAVGQRAGAVVVIEGAAGMGKSRLLDDARVRATELGLRVLSARATELEQGFPFGVMRQLFERAMLEADAGERERWLAGAAALAADVLDSTRRCPKRRPAVQAPVIPATRGSTACTGWPRTSQPIRRSCSWSTICSGAMRRRRARSRSSRVGSRAAARVDPCDPAARSGADARGGGARDRRSRGGAAAPGALDRGGGPALIAVRLRQSPTIGSSARASR